MCPYIFRSGIFIHFQIYLTFFLVEFTRTQIYLTFFPGANHHSRTEFTIAHINMSCDTAGKIDGKSNYRTPTKERPEQ